MVVKVDSKLIPVVVYYRCSSPQQELSVAEQRAEVLTYCIKKGYRIVREYIDEGKSASKNPEKREAFNRMVADSRKGDFRVVVCYDAARFTRFDNLCVGNPKGILRDNSVFLDTVKEGEFNWATPEGRWKDQAYCESNRAASLNLSKDSIRGRKAVCTLGYWPNGVVPYGYNRLYTDGVHSLNVKRHEGFRKGRNWHLRLVLDDAEAAVIREIFDRYCNKRQSRLEIAADLTARGIPSPSGQNGWNNGAWDGDNVATILREKAYITVAVLSGTGKKKPKTVHNRAEQTEQAGSCPRIVDDHIWYEAQQIKQERFASRAKPQTKRGGILSGFVLCGQCGYRLAKHENTRGRYYVCTSAGQRPHLGCRHFRAHESELLPKVCAWLVREIDAELIASLQAKPGKAEGTTEEDALRQHVQTLEDKVANATESALLAPPSSRDAVWTMVKKWQDEAEAARQKLALVEALRNTPELSDFRPWWEREKAVLVQIAAGSFTQYDTPLPGGILADEEYPLYSRKDTLRAFLARLGFSVKLWWEVVGSRRGRSESLYAISSVEISVSVDLTSGSFVPGSSATTGDKRLVIKRVFAWTEKAA